MNERIDETTGEVLGTMPLSHDWATEKWSAIAAKLSEPIQYKVKPKQVVKNKNGGYAALALGYISREQVQARLDEVVGAGGWKTEYQVISDTGKIVECQLSLTVDGEHWITKADVGSPQGQDEGDEWKGAFSDALKRAASHWGIGRFLYNLKAEWLPCEAYEKNGKACFKKWITQPPKVEGASQGNGRTAQAPGKDLWSRLNDACAKLERKYGMSRRDCVSRFGPENTWDMDTLKEMARVYLTENQNSSGDAAPPKNEEVGPTQPDLPSTNPVGDPPHSPTPMIREEVERIERLYAEKGITLRQLERLQNQRCSRWSLGVVKSLARKFEELNIGRDPNQIWKDWGKVFPSEEGDPGEPEWIRQYPNLRKDTQAMMYRAEGHGFTWFGIEEEHGKNLDQLTEEEVSNIQRKMDSRAAGREAA